MRTTLNFTYTLEWKKNPPRGTRKRIFIHTQHSPPLLLGPETEMSPQHDLERIFVRLVDITAALWTLRVPPYGTPHHFYLRPHDRARRGYNDA